MTFTPMHKLSATPVFFVHDTPSALAFYTDTLGFSLDWTYEEQGRPYVVQVSLLGLEIILNQRETADDDRVVNDRHTDAIDDEIPARKVAEGNRERVGGRVGRHVFGLVNRIPENRVR